MPSKWPAGGFWLYGIGQKDGKLAITERIWCGAERPVKRQKRMASSGPKHRGRRRLHHRR